MNAMYENILELCRRDGINVTQMCRQLRIPRSTLSDLGAVRPRQLTLKHAGPIADDPALRDEPIAAYENCKRYLTEDDKADIATLIRLRAEINRGRR